MCAASCHECTEDGLPNGLPKFFGLPMARQHWHVNSLLLRMLQAARTGELLELSTEPAPPALAASSSAEQLAIQDTGLDATRARRKGLLACCGVLVKVPPMHCSMPALWVLSFTVVRWSSPLRRTS